MGCFLQKFNSSKFGCKSYVYIGFDRPAILENRGEIRTITKLDDQLNPCNSTNPSSTCNNQIYKLQLPSTGKWFKIFEKNFLKNFINFGQKTTSITISLSDILCEQSKNSRNYSDFTRPKLCDTPNHGPAYLTLHVVTVTRRAVRDDRRDPFRVEKQFNKGL